jgi:hypothetical protein
MFNITLNSQAIFLHSPDKEFAPVGAKSNIPYETWFGYFKSFLIVNAKKDRIKELFMWWNGWVFSFEKASKLTDTIDGEESSGMDEAIGCLDDVDMEVPIDHQELEFQDDNLLERFDSLAVSMAVTVHQGSNLSSSGSSGVPQPESSFAPGPSLTDLVDQNVILTDSSQAMEEEIGQRARGKGKEKAVDVNVTELKTDMQVKKVVGKRGRGRSKKIAN